MGWSACLAPWVGADGGIGQVVGDQPSGRAPPGRCWSRTAAAPSSEPCVDANVITRTFRSALCSRTSRRHRRARRSSRDRRDCVPGRGRFGGLLGEEGTRSVYLADVSRRRAPWNALSLPGKLPGRRCALPSQLSISIDHYRNLERFYQGRIRCMEAAKSRAGDKSPRSPRTAAIQRRAA